MGNQSEYSSAQTYIIGQQVILAGVVYVATAPVPTNTAPPNSGFWEVVPIPQPSLGIQVLSLVFNGVTFDAPCWGIPADFDIESGIASLGAQLTTGADAVSGLQDFAGDPIPDGWTFPALVFVEEGEIYDIFALSAFNNPSNGGLLFWTESAGQPIVGLSPSGFYLPNIPTSDPGIAGQFYSDSGTVKVSAG